VVARRVPSEIRLPAGFHAASLDCDTNVVVHVFRDDAPARVRLRAADAFIGRDAGGPENTLDWITAAPSSG
jgi:hypothetical protein